MDTHADLDALPYGTKIKFHSASKGKKSAFAHLRAFTLFFGVLLRLKALSCVLRCDFRGSGLNFRGFRVGFGASGRLFFEAFACVCACTVRTL